jgi:hypothetical protein
MWWRDSIWGINDTHSCTIIILYKMKVCVVKNGVETEIPNVDVETDAEADKAVKKYLQENNLKKKRLPNSSYTWVW